MGWLDEFKKHLETVGALEFLRLSEMYGIKLVKNDEKEPKEAE